MKAGYALACLLLAGCTHMEVLDIGSGRHSLTGTAQTNCPEGARNDAFDAATEFCAKSDKKPAIDSFDDRIGLRCSSSIIFRCE